MKLSEVQSHFAALIEADEQLGTFGEPLLFSHFTDPEASRAAIASRLRATGVCIEIGSVEADGETARPAHRYSLVDVRVEVFVAESPQVAHEPRDLTLVERVSAAVQKRLSASEHSARCTGYAAAISEQGYVLHILSFSIPATL